MDLLLERFNYSNRIGSGMDGTFGRLTLPDGTMFYTCECPWDSNKQGVSCVPEGEYELFYDESPLIRRITNGRHTGGWELKAVPGRSECKFHPANWPHELKGCIGVGHSYAILQDKPGIGSSQSAFDVLMEKLGVDKSVTHRLKITPYLAGADWRHE